MALTPLGIIRKFGKMVRGGAGPSQIFLGCLLGILIGMVPGFNLTVVLLIVAAVLFNAPLKVLLLHFAIGKLLCHLLARVTFQVGFVIIHRIGLEGFFAWASAAPLLAWMDLHVYCLVGGLLIGAAVGVLWGWALAGAMTRTRRRLLAMGTSHERVAKAAASRWVRFALWVAMGKQKVSMAEALEKKHPLLRKGGLVLTAVVLVLALAGELIAAKLFFGRWVQAGLQQAWGAEVNIDRAKLSVLGGGIRLEGLQITDRDNPSQNLFQADTLAGDLSIASLLSRQWVIDELKVGHLQTGVERDSPGEVFEKPPAPVEPVLSEEEQAQRLTNYIEQAKRYKQYADRFGEYLRKVREKAADKPVEQEKSRLEELAKTVGYLELAADDVVARRPAWTIRRLEVDTFALPGVERQCSLHGEEITGRPDLNRRPMTVRISGADDLLGEVALRYDEPGEPHSLRLATPKMPVDQAAQLGKQVPVEIQKGTVSLSAEGTFSLEELNIPFTLPLEDLQITPRPGEPVLGLPPETARQLLAGISEMTVYGTLSGTLWAPLVKVDRAKTLGKLQGSLVESGKEELRRRIEGQGVKLPEKPPALPPEVGGILNRLRPSQQEPPKAE